MSTTNRYILDLTILLLSATRIFLSQFINIDPDF